MSARKYWGSQWRRSDIPSEDDSRWNADPDEIYRLLHVQRQRCWVRWRTGNNSNEYSHIKTSRKYEIPRVGLVTKPLDSYAQVEAVIPCGVEYKKAANA